MEGGPPPRAVMQCASVYEHKSQRSLISSSALGAESRQLYIGLSDGHLEEHRLSQDGLGSRLKLSARKRLAQKPVARICILDTVRSLAVLCDDGVLLLDADSFDSYRLPIRGATALAVQPPSTGLPQLAVALRTSARIIRVLVFDVLGQRRAGAQKPAACISQLDQPHPVAIKDMAWVEGNLVLCTSLGYLLLDPRRSTCQPLLSLPEEAISQTMVQPVAQHRRAVLLIDQAGIVVDASGQPASSALTFLSCPSALATAQGFVVAASAEGLHVYDLGSCSCVQAIPFPADQRPAPDQQLLATQDRQGSRVLVAGFRKVWLCVPIALAEQVKQLLAGRNYAAALHLAAGEAAQAAGWAETAFAEAGLLLLQDGRVQEAMDALARCSPSTFQPAELFPLFPQMIDDSRARTAPKQHWGLHGPLQPFEEIAGRQAAWSNGHLTPGQTQADAERAIAKYLLQVREREGVEDLEGVDTLLVRLLSRQGLLPELEALLSAPNSVRPEAVEAQLAESGDSHALALLYAAKGRAVEALRIWQGMLQEPAVGNGRQAAAQGARPRERIIERVTQVLSDEARTDSEAVLHYLPWLLKTSAQHALAVIKGRRLSEDRLLAVTRSEGRDAVLLLLEFLVLECKTRNASLHTELGALLIEEALGLETSGQASADRGAGTARGLRGKLRKLLSESSLYDAAAIRDSLLRTHLFEEQVIVLEKTGDTVGALRVLAIELGNIREALALCARADASDDAYLQLLDMLLHPLDGRQPLLSDACRLLAAQGALLDPMRVIEVLSEDMPLAHAADVFARVMRDRIHRRRQNLICRNLQRSLNFQAAAERAEVMSKHFVMGEERACSSCHLRLGTRMFAALPNGAVVCWKCAAAGQSAA